MYTLQGESQSIPKPSYSGCAGHFIFIRFECPNPSPPKPRSPPPPFRPHSPNPQMRREQEDETERRGRCHHPMPWPSYLLSGANQAATRSRAKKPRNVEGLAMRASQSDVQAEPSQSAENPAPWTEWKGRGIAESLGVVRSHSSVNGVHARPIRQLLASQGHSCTRNLGILPKVVTN